MRNITYTPFGAIQSLTAGRGSPGYYNAVEAYDYNTRLQPWRIQLGTAQSTPNAYNWLVYNYYGQNATACASTSPGGSGGNNGNVMGYFYQDCANSSLGHTAAFTYDGLSRLMTAVATGSSTYNLTFEKTSPSYQGYDRFGNMTCVYVQGQTNGLCPQTTYNTSTNQVSGFVYDAAGNVTDDGTHTYQWDAEGRLVSVDGVAGQACQSTWTACYVYNGLGQRVQKTVSGTTTGFIYGASGQVLAYTSGLSTSQDFIYLGDRLVANYITWTRFPHPNALGSTGTITDAWG